MSEVQIREARLEDVDAVFALERETTEAPHWARDEYLRIVEAVSGGTVRRVLLIADSNGVVTGFAVGAVIGRGEDATGELESVAVAGAWRRRGVGRALCEAVIGWCGTQGVHVVELEVRASSAGAQALYQGLGFAGAGRRKGYYRDPAEDAVLMSRDVRGA